MNGLEPGTTGGAAEPGTTAPTSPATCANCERLLAELAAVKDAAAAARPPAEFVALVKRIEPRAADQLRQLGHHTAATVLERLAELVREA